MMIVCHVFHSLLVMLSQLLCCMSWIQATLQYRGEEDNEKVALAGKKEFSSSFCVFLSPLPLLIYHHSMYVCIRVLFLLLQQSSLLSIHSTVHDVSHLLCIVWTSKIPQNHSCKALYYSYSTYIAKRERREQVYCTIVYHDQL